MNDYGEDDQFPVAPSVPEELDSAEYIPPEHMELVQDATLAIQSCIERITRNLFVMGWHLVRVRDVIQHGSFCIWVREECGLSVRMAEHLMNIHRRLGPKVDLLQVLQPSALYQLSMPSTPEKAIIAVEALIRNGRSPSVKEVVRIIDAHKRPKKQQKVDRASTAARLANALGRARFALNARTVSDCKWLLGEKTATRLDELRIELSSLLDQVHIRVSMVRRTSTKALTVAPAHEHPDDPGDTTPGLPDTETVQELDGSITDDEQVVPGCTVYVREVDTDQEACFTLVTDEPGKPEAGCIHWESPVAQALHYKRVGESVTAHTPGGPIRMAITDIRWHDVPPV